jgi:hypothetical protein
MQRDRNNAMRRTTIFFVAVLLFAATAMSAHAATITVTNTNDSGSGSLRQALVDANDGDTIAFVVTGTIGLTSGGLLIAKNITISGPGSNQLSIDGNQAIVVFGIFPGQTATISGLTITNAEAGAGVWNEQGTLTLNNCAVTSNSYEGLFNDEGTLNVNNCILSANSGGGISNGHDGGHAVLTVIHSEVSGNSYGIYNDHGESSITNCIVSSNHDGGLFNNGTSGGPNDYIFGAGSLTIADSIITDNSGSGVDNNAGHVTIVDSTISGNSGQSDAGGGVYTYQKGGKTPGNLTVINSTISGNFAFSAGGGIACGFSGLTIINSTISGNSAGDYGGAIANGSLGLMIVNSTVSGNSAATCGGVCGGTVEIGNTILNANTSGNIDGTVTSHGYNISSDDAGGLLNGPGDQINTDPLLGPLQNNGGPTLTHALLPGSPAIDAGDPNFSPPPFNDQRGCPFDRVFNGRIDIGSFETQPPRRPCATPRPRPTPAPRP